MNWWKRVRTYVMDRRQEKSGHLNEKLLTEEFAVSTWRRYLLLSILPISHLFCLRRNKMAKNKQCHFTTRILNTPKMIQWVFFRSDSKCLTFWYWWSNWSYCINLLQKLNKMAFREDWVHITCFLTKLFSTLCLWWHF